MGRSVQFVYMHNAKHNPLGLYGHAMLLSLPPVLLVWAILTFTISIIAFVVQGITITDIDWNGAAWTVVGVFVLIFVAVIVGLYTLSHFWSFRSVRSFLSYIGCRREQAAIKSMA